MKPMYTKKEFEDIGEKVIDWCIDEFGLSKHYEHYPYIEIDIDEEDYSLMGEFIGDNNEIIIYPKAMENMDDFVSTVIHEYTHYMQSPSWYTRYLNNLTLNEVIKNKHPYEIQAEQISTNNYIKCRNNILK
jgi:hypothetical protein